MCFVIVCVECTVVCVCAKIRFARFASTAVFSFPDHLKCTTQDKNLSVGGYDKSAGQELLLHVIRRGSTIRC